MINFDPENGDGLSMLNKFSISWIALLHTRAGIGELLKAKAG